ncbi:hypothetical protein R5R35_007493 [Gryllus longicercus]|uniref:Uncharacterized protein n=1 Tax=Gryllus longicercus TaxID=2509291 RepID=A0AAN9VU46_9ORTH
MKNNGDFKGKKKGDKDSSSKMSLLRYMSNYDDVPGELDMDNCNINSQDELGDSPLHISVRHGHLKCADLFLKAGADVNVRRLDGYSVLHTAAARGYTDLIRSLIEKGAIVNAKTEDGETPLHSAVRESKPESAEVLLRNGASVNAVFGEIDMTALHVAVSKSPNCIEVLISNNANIFAMNRHGVCPLELAMEVGFHRFLEVSEGKPNAESVDGITALHLASRCLNGECLEMLVAGGCDVNVTTDKGDTPLHYASEMEKFLECEKNKDQVKFSVIRNIELLLKAGANINKKNNGGLTPLHFSSRHNQSFATEHLLNRGANANVRGGKRKRTALHLASDIGNLPCIKFLLEYGADKLVVDGDNNTALMLAARKSHFACVRVLLQNDVPLWT